MPGPFGLGAVGCKPHDAGTAVTCWTHGQERILFLAQQVACMSGCGDKLLGIIEKMVEPSVDQAGGIALFKFHSLVTKAGQ